MNTFGDRLKKLRTSIKPKMSQKDFGKLFGLSESAVGMYERNERKPDYEVLQKISEYFSVSTDYLITGKDFNSETKENSSTTVTVAGQSVSLSPDELRVFKELIKHQAMFHDLATDPEKKVKQLIKLYKMKKILFEEDDDDEEYGDGFGEFED